MSEFSAEGRGQQARDGAARDEQQSLGWQPDAEQGMDARKKQ